ncbi:rna-binding region-containing protein 3 [Citrus sinensis]|uniref:Rna-binding region-containing protein 3 n=1 Tax=Citrus sinensis TaxID=2711 RepID=A0ACB8MFE3_CITSI|nr:rna-binding region-containing protein 3 [Citrus sinensis]
MATAPFDSGPQNKQEAENLVTLLIKHLPDAIPQDTLSRIFSHYGASSVRPCSAGRLRNCVFVDFGNEPLASQAQMQLNGLRFLGKVLSVERASKPNEENKHKHFEAQSISSMKEAAVTRNQREGLNSGSVPAAEPIAPRLGVDYPFPPHLEYAFSFISFNFSLSMKLLDVYITKLYAYPPVDGNILTNIVNALIAVPRFYTQVLHLMNKMNIPAPFRMALPTPPLPPPVPTASAPQPPPLPPSVPVQPTPPPTADLSSSESEMDSDEDNDKGNSFGNSEVAKPGRKRARRESIVGPAINKDVAHEAVGVKPATLTRKEIPVIKKKNPVLQVMFLSERIYCDFPVSNTRHSFLVFSQIKITPKASQTEDKDDSVAKELEEPNKEDSDVKPFATPEELEMGKLPPEEILSLPMFKNYAAGNPASVLYIKNLAKDVIPDDFFFIFGSLFGSIDAAKCGLTVKLMQEGRMRGQAFVTFPSVELAHRALLQNQIKSLLQQEEALYTATFMVLASHHLENAISFYKMRTIADMEYTVAYPISQYGFASLMEHILSDVEMVKRFEALVVKDRGLRLWCQEGLHWFASGSKQSFNSRAQN